MTTTPVPVSRADALAYEQTMYLPGQETSVYFAFENVGAMAVFGILFFLLGAADTFVDAARHLISESYCKIHQRIDIKYV